jgi:hypothetical protein
MEWNKTAVIYFKVLYQHFPAITEANRKSISQDSQSGG